MATKPKPQDRVALIQGITNRFRVTAREARDIVTAVGTVWQTEFENAKKQRTGYSNSQGPSGKNIIKQVGETARAAATGKKGTTSDRVKVSGPMSAQSALGYEKGKKRK